MSKDYMKAFATLLNATFFRHRGCLVERSANGFKWNGTTYPTEELVKEAINKAFPELQQSINRIRDENRDHPTPTS